MCKERNPAGNPDRIPALDTNQIPEADGRMLAINDPFVGLPPPIGNTSVDKRDYMSDLSLTRNGTSRILERLSMEESRPFQFVAEGVQGAINNVNSAAQLLVLTAGNNDAKFTVSLLGQPFKVDYNFLRSPRGNQRYQPWMAATAYATPSGEEVDVQTIVQGRFDVSRRLTNIANVGVRCAVIYEGRGKIGALDGNKQKLVRAVAKVVSQLGRPETLIEIKQGEAEGSDVINLQRGDRRYQISPDPADKFGKLCSYEIDHDGGINPVNDSDYDPITDYESALMGFKTMDNSLRMTEKGTSSPVGSYRFS